MERRRFLRLALGVAGSTAALAVSARAAPLVPLRLLKNGPRPRSDGETRPAVSATDEVEQLKPEEIHWRRHRRWHDCGCPLYGHTWYCPFWRRGYYWISGLRGLAG
jgi:hypothetical protein